MLETLVAVVTAAAFVLVIILTSGPRPKRAREQRGREYTAAQALNELGDDADRIFR